MTTSEIPTTPSRSGPASTVSSSYRRNGLSPRQRRLLQAAARARAANASAESGHISSPSAKAPRTSPASPFTSNTPQSLPLSPIACSTPSPPLKMRSQEYQNTSNSENEQPSRKLFSSNANEIEGGTISASGSGASTAITDATTVSIGDDIRRLRLDNNSAHDNDAEQAMKGKVSDRIRRFSNNHSYANKNSETNNISHVRCRGWNDPDEGHVTNSESKTSLKGPLHQHIEEEGNEFAPKPELMVATLTNSSSPNRERLSSPMHNKPPSQFSSHPKLPQQELRRVEEKDSKYQSIPICNKTESELRYYRITFKGIVSLLSELGTGQGLVKTAIETDIPGSSFGKGNMEVKRSGVYVGYGEIVATSSPEFKIPLDADGDTQHDAKRTIRAIRVDSILTGGYAADAGHAETPFLKQENCSSNVEVNESLDHDGPRCDYGYLIICDGFGQTVAEIVTSKSGTKFPSYEHGSFIYRVRASSPVKVLSGPYLDAPPMRCALLPGSMHQVSLRVSVPLSDRIIENVNEVDDLLVDDADAGEIQYLRLGQRKGWVADRRIDTLDDDGKKLRVSYLMQDVTDTEGLNRTLVDPLMSHSFNFGDTSSLNSTSIVNSVSNASFYSSVVASSVMTPPSVKSQRKRNVRRRTGIGATRSTLPTLLRENPRSSTDRSFDETSSTTGGGGITVVSGEGSLSGCESARVRSRTELVPSLPKESYYLMRVIAPLGLKILDAPHFQVSNLIHTPSPIKPNIRSPHSSPGISPFARTNASIFQASMIKNSFSSESLSKVKNNSRVRFLARGQIFEASQRMESTDAAYTNGQGLIKLTDGSGWVIIPHQEEIIKQYENFRGAVDVNNIIAYEEIGSAEIISTQSNPAYHATPSERSRRNESERSPNDVVWLRIAAPNGVKVILPPTIPDHTVRRDERDRAIKPSTSGTDSEVASTVSSSFFDSMWSKVTPTKQKEGRGAAHDGATAKLHHPSPRHGKNVAHNAPPVISCGMVVPVEHWENYQDDVDGNSKKSFVRLFGGQGWIPLTLGGTTYSYEVDSPDTRIGSFWFRVQSSKGVEVRHGPSPQALPIKSDIGTAFRFECGEFLRASEIVTVFTSKQNEAGTAESFAKLYRKHRGLSRDCSSQNLLDRFKSLQTITYPGEWVQVHGNGELHLEECSMPPSIDRLREGWRFSAVHQSGVQIRRGPSFQAETTGNVLRSGEVFFVVEKVVAFGDQVTWLRLRNGGWVHNVNEKGEAVVHLHTIPSQTRQLDNDTEYSQKMVHRILNNGSHNNQSLD